jgi:hydroxymethylglutaryl-CoA reductase
MVIEEPSVIAAVSKAAKLFRQGGGFQTSSDPLLMIGQIQIIDMNNIERTIQSIQENTDQILSIANETGGSIVRKGGGAQRIEIHRRTHPLTNEMIIIHLIYDTLDAMGANTINTALENIAPFIEEITKARVNLRILSNLSDQRKARATGTVPKEILTIGQFTSDQVIQRILESTALAEVDPYRAATHNKGIMNGIDAVAIATGNDWRAIEAGAHAYAARRGHYTSLTKWTKDGDGNLKGEIELPLAVGSVGGATKVHPGAKTALRILRITRANQLAEIMAAVGLAQNFAAILALSTDGIQKGHMRMHARQLATAAGAKLEQINEIVYQMIQENNIRLERAIELVQMKQEKDK